MPPVAYLAIIIASLIIVFGARALLRSWQQETNRTAEDDKFDHRLADYNDRLAYRQRDDEIVNILRGRDVPTVADRYGTRPSNDDDYDDYDDYDD